MPAGCHPELDESQLLDLNGICKCQMLIGMAQWACTIGCLDIAFAVSSLSHFSANLQIGHLALAVRLSLWISEKVPKSTNCVGLPSINH
jgi:hypothetical protein